jgi:hypothetical protein
VTECRKKMARKSTILRRKGVGCLGKGEIASSCNWKFRRNSL